MNKAWLVCLVLIISAAVVDQAVAAEPSPANPSPSAGNGGDNKNTHPAQKANVYQRGCSKLLRCRNHDN
ncbi:hypothetical protein TIFTF001_019411 [Ficus carica]|uniref:Uncharacterized protein n=1 Tax=Ficus carica TaxID=3494 RepID=A0AA88ACX8_FICCA|nr:hypothetical protein TIFTF001_019411 [Ficus carica]